MQHINPTRYIGQSPHARVINITPRKKRVNVPIRIDLLNKLEHPVIMIVRRLGGIGDVLMTLPMLATIKTLLPKCYLVYATDLEYSNGALGEIIRHNPYVDELIPNKDIKNIEADYQIDITTTGLSREKPQHIPPNRIDMFAEEAGLNVDANPIPLYYVNEAERMQATEDIELLLEGVSRDKVKVIIVQCRSNDARRTWPFRHIKELASLLARHEDFRIILMDWGNSVNEWQTDTRIYTVLDKPFVNTMALVEQADLIICPDSSMLHMAGALNKKTIGIFGPVPPECRINHYHNTSALRIPLSCHPCFYNPICAKSLKESEKMRCLTELKPQLVYEAALNKLQEEEKPPVVITKGHNLTTANQDKVILVNINKNMAGIGDCTMALNAIETLKVRFPGRELHLRCDKERHIVFENSSIDKMLDLSVGINYKTYESVFDISNCCSYYESTRYHRKLDITKNRTEIYAEALGVRHLVKDIKPRYYVSDQEREQANEFLNTNTNKNKQTIYLALQSAEIYRDYPLEYWQQLIDLLFNYNVILAGAMKINNYTDCIDIRRIGIKKTFAILSLCDLIVGVDSAPIHVAAALNKKIIGLYGPIDYRARCKGYDNTTIIKSDLDCIPCWRNATMKCKQENQVNIYSKCLKNISPNKITQVIRKVINNA